MSPPIQLHKATTVPRVVTGDEDNSKWSNHNNRKTYLNTYYMINKLQYLL